MKLPWLAGTGRTKFEFHRPSSCRSLWLNSNLTDLEIECTYYSAIVLLRIISSVRGSFCSRTYP
jgi:hypothetical protein